MDQEQWYTFVLYLSSLILTKISILLLYSRILVQGTMRNLYYATFAIVMISNIWVIISAFIQCIPLQAVWDRSVQGWCLGNSASEGNSILHIITDFLIFLIPIPVVVRLKMGRKQKMGLLGVFLIGFV
jgi:hypothetical protein